MQVTHTGEGFVGDYRAGFSYDDSNAQVRRLISDLQLAGDSQIAWTSGVFISLRFVFVDVLVAGLAIWYLSSIWWGLLAGMVMVAFWYIVADRGIKARIRGWRQANDAMRAAENTGDIVLAVRR